MAPGPDQQGPQPGPPSPDAPTDLRVVTATASRVELRWVNHAQGAEVFVVQRCTGGDCTDFANLIGQPGKDVATAIDDKIQPGLTYRYRVYSVSPTPQGPRGTGVSNEVKVKVPER